METGPRFIVPSDGLEKPEIKIVCFEQHVLITVETTYTYIQVDQGLFYMPQLQSSNSHTHDHAAVDIFVCFQGPPGESVYSNKIR